MLSITRLTRSPPRREVWRAPALQESFLLAAGRHECGGQPPKGEFIGAASPPPNPHRALRVYNRTYAIAPSSVFRLSARRAKNEIQKLRALSRNPPYRIPYARHAAERRGYHTGRGAAAPGAPTRP